MTPFLDNGTYLVEEDLARGGYCMSFPAMFSIRDSYTSRPGYLHHLSGLKNLETLGGSIRVDTVEGRYTAGWSEATWIDQNWPSLRYCAFFTLPKLITQLFQWLLDRRLNKSRPEFGVIW